MADDFNWHCLHCRHKVTITDSRVSWDMHSFVVKNSEGARGLVSQFIACPNPTCQKLDGQRRKEVGAALGTWKLIPESDARPWPNHVPQATRDDYREACLIRDLSPKDSATLSRRALQGILRDFFKVKPDRLVDEIKQVGDTMGPDLLQAVDAVRKVGNIGAHMEADIDLVVDVDPNEAQLLIGLVETLLDETYVYREKRRARIAAVTALAAQKDAEKKGTVGALPPPAKA
jgi:hypothetical protein